MLRTRGAHLMSGIMAISVRIFAAGWAGLWRLVKPSFAIADRIQAPWSGAGEREIKEDEAVDRSELAAIHDRIEALARVRDEIGGRGEAREDEGHRPGEQAEREQDAADQLDQSADAAQRADLNVGEHRHRGKTDNLRGAVLKQAETRENAQDAEEAERVPPGRTLFMVVVSPDSYEA